VTNPSNQLKNILIISPEAWDFIKVSKHHYAVELVRSGNRVYFLNPPDATSYRGLRIAESGIEHLYVIDYPGQLMGMRFLPGYLRRQINYRFLKKLERLVDHRIDVVWNFENSRFYDMGFAKNRLKIYHQVDLNQNFHVKEAALSADICFCTTDFIKSKIVVYNKKVYKIHHGVSQSAFLKVQTYETTGKPVATLVGNLDISYLDHELLQKLIIQNEGVQFNLVGEYDKEGIMYRRFYKHKNVRFIGRISSESIKDYLLESDVLLVCYKANDYKEQLASPHKMMEYFASGKIIVATYTDEYKDKQHLLLMSDSKEEYMLKFKKAIDNLDFFNSPEKQAERVAFAREHTYRRQLEKINEFIKMNFLPEIL